MEVQRYRGRVTDFGRGYGFIHPMNALVATANSTSEDEAASKEPQHDTKTSHAKIDRNEKRRRIFFHIRDVERSTDAVELVPGMLVTYSLIMQRDDREAAVRVRDGNDRPFAFGKDATTKERGKGPGVNMSVSAAGRHVGVVSQWDAGKPYGFLVDQHTGDRVFVHYRSLESFSRRGERKGASPPPVSSLASGQRVEFEPEMTEKGLSAADVTGPMGAPLEKATSAPSHRPTARPQTHQQQQQATASKARPAGSTKGGASARGGTGKQASHYDDDDYNEDDGYDEYFDDETGW